MTAVHAMDVADARSRSGGVRVLGRLLGPSLLCDATGTLDLRGQIGDAKVGDLVWIDGSLTGRSSAPLLEIESIEVVRRGDLSLCAGLESGPERFTAATDRLARLRERFTFVSELRRWLGAHGFLEIDGPGLLPAAGTDVHIDPVEVRFRDLAGHLRRGFLHTSPELSLKRLLVAGFPRIFFLGSVFRAGEISHLHQLEFTMAEWYRAGATYEDMMSDVEQLVLALLGGVSQMSGEAVAIPSVIPRVTVREAFLDATGVDLAACIDAGSLARALAARGLPSKGDQYDELFFRVFVDLVEPALARHPAVFLTDYPAPLAALARLKPDQPQFAERFELYIRGIELANGYTELTDPDEQRARFEADLRARRRRGLAPLPLPEDFLRALAVGMPPAGGVSLGVDRLYMLKSGVSDIRELVAFPWTPHSFHQLE